VSAALSTVLAGTRITRVAKRIATVHVDWAEHSEPQHASDIGVVNKALTQPLALLALCSAHAYLRAPPPRRLYSSHLRASYSVGGLKSVRDPGIRHRDIRNRVVIAGDQRRCRRRGDGSDG
jgi:hypothetical protein